MIMFAGGKSSHSYFSKQPLFLKENSSLFTQTDIPNGIKIKQTAIPTDMPMPAAISAIVKLFFDNHQMPQSACGNRMANEVRSPGA